MQSKKVDMTFVRIDLLKKRASAEALFLFKAPQLARTIEKSFLHFAGVGLPILNMDKVESYQVNPRFGSGSANRSASWKQKLRTSPVRALTETIRMRLSTSGVMPQSVTFKE